MPVEPQTDWPLDHQYVRDWDETFMFASNWKDALAPYKEFGSPPESTLRYVCPTSERAYAFNAGLGGATADLAEAPETLAMFYEPSRSVNADAGQSWVVSGIHKGGSNVCFHDSCVSWLKTKPTFWTGELLYKDALKQHREEEWRLQRKYNETQKRQKQRAKSP